MYRVAKRTTKRTKYKCLECKHVKPDTYKVQKWGCMVECNAPNRCLTSRFNAKDFYCIEYKGFNDMTESDKENIRREVMNDWFDERFKEHAKKYYPKAQAKKMIDERRQQRGIK